jgi:hypothetical protein
MGRIIPYNMENKTCLKAPTRFYFGDTSSHLVLRIGKVPKQGINLTTGGDY